VQPQQVAFGTDDFTLAIRTSNESLTFGAVIPKMAQVQGSWRSPGSPPIALKFSDVLFLGWLLQKPGCAPSPSTLACVTGTFGA
jgi:hypothetical protein